MEALIGHLPRTHTQLYSDLNTTNNNLSKCLSPRDTLKESADNCRKNGCWRVNGDYQPVNGVNDGILLAFDAMGNGNVVYQQLFNNVGGALYVRRYWFNGWSNWVDIALKSDLVDAVTYNPMLMYDGSKTVAAFCQSVKSGTTAVVYAPSNYDTKTTGIPEKGACFITVYKSTTSGYGFFDALMSGGKHYYCTEDNGKTSGWT